MTEVFRELAIYALTAVDILVKFVVVAVVLLMLLRWALLKISPFGWATYHIRRLTDPMIWPLAQNIPMPNSMAVAPLLLVLFTILGAFFFKWVVEDILKALIGVIGGLSAGAFLDTIGWLLYGTVSVILALIVARIVLSWLPFGRDSRLLWMLHGLTEPIMAPFRRIIPPMGMLDLSPIILIFLLHFVQGAIYGILIQ